MIDIEQSKEESTPVKVEKPKVAVAKKPAAKKIVATPVVIASVICPKCKTGTMLKGKTAFGCSEYKNSCTFKVMFEQYGKMLTEKQLLPLIQNGKSQKIQGLTLAGQQVDSALMFDSVFNVVLAS